eukprot:scaffold111695_cov32-Tisochrysis_lutea.AAC.2
MDATRASDIGDEIAKPTAVLAESSVRTPLCPFGDHGRASEPTDELREGRFESISRDNELDEGRDELVIESPDLPSDEFGMLSCDSANHSAVANDSY